jgi:hypothetical protein
MFTRHSARFVATIVSAVVLNFCLATVTLSQTLSAADVTSKGDETPEEVIVYGKTNIIILRNALYRAEEDFFDLFNSLNSNDEFDVKCEKHQTALQRRRHTLHSGMSTRRCSPSFALAYEAWVTQRYMMNGGLGGMADPASANLDYRALVRVKQKEMVAEMAELIEANPEFLNKIDELERAHDALAAEKGRRGPCAKIFCRK